MTYNGKEKSWEIAIKLFQDDLETALSVYSKRNFKVSADKEVEKVLESYVRKHFGFSVNKSFTNPLSIFGI